MHFGYGDDNWLVYNTDQLFKDLPFIINQVIKENKKMQKMYLNNIVTELKDIDYSILQDDDVEYDEQLKNDPSEIEDKVSNPQGL